MSEDGRFLSRWSQRKRQVAEEARKAAEATPAPAPEAESGAEEPFDLSLLPDLEALTPETDISLFLQKGVPDGLRNAALRKMWALDPAIRDYVGDALDYAWDWNAPGGVPGGGELGEGFDTTKMVAQIFGDDPTDKNVIADVAVQQEEAEVVASIAKMPESGGSEQPPEIENAAASCTSAQVGLKPEDKPGSVAVHKTRRHGGATPVV